jgi:TolB protein
MIVVAVASAVGANSGGAAHARFQAREGWIVYWGDGAPSVFAARADGSGAMRLTRFRSNAKRGDVSPDGRLLVFDGGPQTGERPDDFDVQVISVDGSRRRTVAGTSQREIDGRFSPDGAWISYSKQSPSGIWSVWIASADGSQHRRVGIGSSARWSPNGRYLFFARDLGGQSDLYRMNVNGSGVKRLTATADLEGPADWSPDGRTLLFTRSGVNAGIYVMRTDGSRIRRLTRSPEGQAGAWSPDGRLIAYTSGTQPFVMNADGTGRKRVLGTPPVEVTTWERRIG